MASQTNARELQESERTQTEQLLEERREAEEVMVQLRSEAAGLKQDLQDALELCNQHEVLLDERNKELSACDAEIR